MGAGWFCKEEWILKVHAYKRVPDWEIIIKEEKKAIKYKGLQAIKNENCPEQHNPLESQIKIKRQ